MVQSGDGWVGGAGNTWTWTLGDVAVGGWVRHTLNQSQTQIPTTQNSWLTKLLHQRNNRLQWQQHHTHKHSSLTSKEMENGPRVAPRFLIEKRDVHPFPPTNSMNLSFLKHPRLLTTCPYSSPMDNFSNSYLSFMSGTPFLWKDLAIWNQSIKKTHVTLQMIFRF